MILADCYEPLHEKNLFVIREQGLDHSMHMIRLSCIFYYFLLVHLYTNHAPQGTPITKALTCMKIYLYKQKWQFYQRDLYFWIFCCMNNFCISHRSINLHPNTQLLSTKQHAYQSFFFGLLPGLIPFASLWHAG